MRRSSAGKLVPVILGFILLIAEGVNYSQIGPFFPTEASIHKGISTTSIGIITGAFDVANLFAAIVFASFITPKNQKVYFCAGALISATCNGLFGIMIFVKGGTVFVILCTLIRVLMGTGASMLYSTWIPLLVPLYPGWSGRLTAMYETSFALGLMLGPLIGSLLFSVGGYITPFTFAACSQILIVIFCIIALPNKAATKNAPASSENLLTDNFEVNEESQKPLLEKAEEKTELTGYTFAYFATRPSVLTVTFTLAFHSSTNGFIDVALGPYLLEKFGVDGNTAGFYFLVFLGVYLLFLPTLGFLVDRGQAGKIFIIACLASAFGFAGLSLPVLVSSLETKCWVILCLMVLGASDAGGFAAIYLVLEKLAYSCGFQVESNVKLMVASLSNACFACGRLLGSAVIGGVFMEHFGYYYSCLLLGGLFFVSFLSCGYVSCNKGLLRNIYYRNQE